MNDASSGRRSQAAALAEAFDQSFAIARAPDLPAWRDFLAVRISDAPYALPLADLGEIAPLGRITPLPGAAGACLGLAGLRGVITPVYDLRVLLDHPAPSGVARWLATLADARVALTFDAIEGHLRLPDASPVQFESDGRLIRGAVQTAAGLRPLVDISAVLAAIRRLARRIIDPTSDN
ncbi:chemotaxis protein CheW [Phenylobacterium sp. LjRoot225]|uniref:chemotaxis protein CheW n=1 Tax=Phenylobacterium sp. LjRoot225 TaxID=3342285 RepID=UPI003ECDB10D